MSRLVLMGAVIAALAGLFGFRTEVNPVPVEAERVPVVAFDFHCSGSSTFDCFSYTVEMDDVTGEMTVSCDFYCGSETHTLPADNELMQALSELVVIHNIRNWDGFRKHDSAVLDGYSFGLNVGLQDGTEITASGSNCFPKGYGEARSAINDLFRDYLKKYGIEPDGGQ